MAAGTPGLCRRQVRDTVRAARQARGLTQQQAATALDWSLSKLARIETGRCGISVTDVQALLVLYQVSQDQTGPVLEMARAARTRPWYARYPVAMTVPGLARYLEFGAVFYGFDLLFAVPHSCAPPFVSPRG